MEQTKQPQKLTDWSRVRSAILKKYPNLTKTQLASLDGVIKKRQVEQAVRAGVIAPKDIALEYPDVAARLANEGVTGPTSKEESAKQGIIGTVDELKKTYNQPLPNGEVPDPSRGDLSYGKVGEPSTLASLGANFEILMGRAPDAKTYKRVKDAFTASLKELTGDTGVLTDQDFQRLNNALPNFGDTDESASKAWSAFDNILQQKLGKTGKYSYIATKEAIKNDPLFEQAKSGQMSSSITKLTSGSKTSKTPIDIKQYEDSPFLKSLASVQDFLANSPVVPAGAGLVGSVFGPLGTFAGVLGGRQLQRAAKERGEGQGFLESITQNPFNSEDRNESVGDVKAAGISALIDQFFRGGGIKGNLSKVRDVVANRSTATIAGDQIAEAGRIAAANSASSLKGPASRVATQAAQDFGGKTLTLPEAIAARTASGTASRSMTSGSIKAGGANVVEDAIRSSLRSGIRTASPLTGTIDDVLSTVFKTQKGLGRVINPSNLGNAAATAGLFTLLKKFGILSGGQ